MPRKRREQGRTYFILPEGLPELSIGERYVVNVLRRAGSRRKLDRNGYFPLSSKLLEKVLGSRNYRREIDSLIERGIIQRDDSYSTGVPQWGVRGKCKRYRLIGRWRRAKTEIVEVVGDSRRSRGMIHTIRNSAADAEANHLKEIAGLANGAAYLYCFDVLRSRMQCNPVKWCEFGIGLEEQQLRRAMARWNSVCEGWLQNHFELRWFNVCKQRRLHTNFTSLRLDLLPYLQLDGDDGGVVEADTRTSQVVFLAGLLADHNVLGSDGLCEIASQGELYDIIADEAGVTRGDAKQSFFRYAYGRPGHSNEVKKPCEDFMTKWFPNCAGFIDGSKRKHGHAWLSRAMQRQEADFMFGYVVPILMAENIALVTRHDGVMVRKGLGQRALSAMYQAFDAAGIGAAVRLIPRVRSTEHIVEMA